jgi:hypothetical protein
MLGTMEAAHGESLKHMLNVTWGDQIFTVLKNHHRMPYTCALHASLLLGMSK